MATSTPHKTSPSRCSPTSRPATRPRHLSSGPTPAKSWARDPRHQDKTYRREHYVREDGSPSVSFRGSTQVFGPGELALWARKTDSGLASAVAKEPRVSLVY